MKSGGHGQKGMLLLDKYGITYNIVKTYPNGVRVGNMFLTIEMAENVKESDNLGFPRHGLQMIFDALVNTLLD